MSAGEHVAIELAGAEDVPAMLALSNAAAAAGPANFATEPESLESWQRSYEAGSDRYPWLVARRGLTVKGFARATPHKARGAYAWTAETSVYVDPSAHGRGVGRALYAALIATTRAQGYATLLAGITIPNAASARLHESFGFVQCAVFHRVGWKLGEWRDVGYWELALRRGAEAPPPIRAVRDVWVALDLGEEPLGDASSRALIDTANAELTGLYPEPGATHFGLDPQDTTPGRGAFLVGRVDGEPVACGAVRKLDDARAEIKRMYVAPAWRGRGVASRVLAALEHEARSLGVKQVVLETGDRQRAAMSVYARAGYRRIAPFGEYASSPLSVCLAKELGAAYAVRE